MVPRLLFIRCFKTEDCRCLGGLEGLHDELHELNKKPRPMEQVDHLGIRIYLTLCCLSSQCPMGKYREEAAKELRKPTYDRWRDK